MTRARNIRIVSEDLGILRKVLSFEEKNDGSILIGMNQASDWIDLDDFSEDDTFGQHYSVHPAPSLPDITVIKHTLDARHGQYQSVSHIRGLARGGLWPLFYRAYVDLRQDRYLYRTKKSEDVRSLGTIDFSRQTLVLMVAVSRAPSFLPVEETPNFKVEGFRLGEFHCSIAYCWANYPAPRFGAIGHKFSMRYSLGKADLHRLNRISEPIPKEQLASEIPIHFRNACLNQAKLLAYEIGDPTLAFLPLVIPPGLVHFSVNGLVR